MFWEGSDITPGHVWRQDNGEGARSTRVGAKSGGGEGAARWPGGHPSVGAKVASDHLAVTGQSSFFQKQKPKGIVLPKVNGKEEKKTQNIQKQQKGKPQGAFIKKVTRAPHVQEGYLLCSCTVPGCVS